MKRKTIAAVLLAASVLVSCSKAPEVSESTAISIRELPSQESTEETSSETSEEVTETSAEASETTVEPTVVEPAPIDDPFAANASLYAVNGELPCFGNLTPEEYEYFSGVYGKSTYDCLFLTEEPEPVAYCGFLVSNFDGPENAYLRHVLPYPINPSAVDSNEPVDIRYAPVSDINAALTDVLGIDMNGLSLNPFTTEEHDGASCVCYSTGSGMGPNIHFVLLGGNVIDSDYYLCFEETNGSNFAGISIAHFVRGEDGSFTLVGCRYADRWTTGSHRVISDEQEIAAEDIETDILSTYYDAQGTTRYYTWGPNADQAMASDAFALELLRDTYYAHHGCIFSDPYVQTYFDSRAWYTGTTPEAQFAPYDLNAIEDTNVATIESMMG